MADQSSSDGQSPPSGAPLGSGAVCSAVDQTYGTSDFGITYISQSKFVVLRESPYSVESHAVISPAEGDDKPSSGALRDRLIDLGVDCGLAVPLSYVSATAACGGTVVTMGVASPLCAFAAVGAGTASLKCGNAIGKMINHSVDPALDEELNKNKYYNTYETAVDAIDIIANMPGAYKNIKELNNLGKITSKYGKNISRYTKAESKKIYREVCTALGEALSNQKAKQFINSLGLSHRYSPAVISPLIEKRLIETGITSVNTYDTIAEVNSRHELTHSLPSKTIVKDSLRSISDANTRSTRPPVHTIHMFQQATQK